MKAFQVGLSMRFIMALIWAPGPSSYIRVLPAAVSACSADETFAQCSQKSGVRNTLQCYYYVCLRGRI